MIDNIKELIVRKFLNKYPPSDSPEPSTQLLEEIDDQANKKPPHRRNRPKQPRHGRPHKLSHPPINPPSDAPMPSLYF